jgi:phosphoglycerate dehydrogenase-like enzyme
VIVAAVAPAVLEAAGRLDGVALRGLDGRLDDVEFLVPEWAQVVDFAALPALRVVQLTSAGTDGVEERLPAGVTLCNARGARDIPVAEWVVGAIVGAATGLLAAVRDPRWEHQVPAEVHGSRVLIVGHGSIGQAAATRLEALGAEVEGVGRARLGELTELVARADVVVNLVPLTGASRGMFDARVLAAMPDGALFFNAGRGATVDQAALLAETGSGRLRAVLDVTDPEPLPPGDALWSARGVLAITSHQAGDSAEADARAVRFAVDQLRAYAAGEPLRNVVKPWIPRRGSRTS